MNRVIAYRTGNIGAERPLSAKLLIPQFPPVTCEAFRDVSTLTNVGFFGTCPTPELAKRPIFSASLRRRDCRLVCA